MKKLLIIFLLFSFQIFSQDKDWSWDDYSFTKFDYSTPFVEINYGNGNLFHEKFGNNFLDNGLIGLKLGYLKHSENDDILTKHEYSYFFFDRISPSISNKKSIELINYEILRFGLGFKFSYGYNNGNIKILPYNSFSFTWSKIDFKQSILIDGKPEFIELMNRYDNSFRFGQSKTSGLEIIFFDKVGISADYQLNTIFPRYLTWKHFGSFIIEASSFAILNNFLDDISESSYFTAPIVSFLLKTGLSYGFYELSKKDMNWPFPTESPMMHESFTMSLNFYF